MLDPDASPDTLPSDLEVADAIGARLCRDALWAGPRCNWLGASMEPVDGRWAVVQRTFGPDLYGGTSGIALFLGQLHRLIPERIFRMTALGALRHALSRLDDIAPQVAESFYTGAVGVAHACLELARDLEEPSLKARGLELLEGRPPVPFESHANDLLNGFAGAIPIWLEVAERHGRPDFLDRAVRSGVRLLETARRGPHGWSWDTGPGEPDRADLLGFSHGTAGLAWCLIELYRVTGEERFRQGALEAFAYERHWFSPEHQNWPDLRSNLRDPGAARSEPGYMSAWCHGAPGIALSRFRALEVLDDPTCRDEALVAARTTARSLEQTMAAGRTSFCLCHGLSGNAAVLSHAAHALGDTAWNDLAHRIGRFGAERYGANRAPWPCGVPDGGETPGLFLGLAGIGHFYLRLADPDHVPSVIIHVPRRK